MRIELHTHTTASDGALTPIDLIKLAKKKGLDGVAVTDHDTFRGADLALRAARMQEHAPLVIPGAEMRTEYGDVLVLCPQPEPGAPKELAELRDWADDRGCILVAAHPFHPGRHSLMSSLKTKLEYFDAIEVWNSRGLPVLNLPAMRLAEKACKPGTSGSDVHVPRELGLSPSIVEDVDSVEDVIEAIRRGRVRPTLGLLTPLAVAEILAWAIARRI
ncbi:MAG: PHP domain-containing protein [Desulfurococcales archaeon]|nr:PHP domain-containing protein [Desulfurococcales archaeon]